MKIFKFILALFIVIYFSACTSKVQNEMLNSSKDDVSNLLNKLIEKEKEINKLNQKLEDCKNNKK